MNAQDQPLLGREAFERLADAGLGEAGGDGIAAVEVLLQREAGGLTRFANSQVHQNVWREDLSASVRVVTDDGRVGVAGIHTDDPAGVAEAARRAAAIARVSPPDPQFPGLAPAAEIGGVPVDDATLAASPEDRAAAVRALLAEVPTDSAGHEAAGAYETAATELGVFTTAGQRAYAPLSSASLTLVVTGPSSSGYAEAGGRAIGDIDAAGAARTAVDKVRAGEDPIQLEAGSWPVVLEPSAVGTLMMFLSYTGFGGRAYLEGRSFASERLGEQVADAAISITDDARSPETIGFPFDAEGTPKQRLVLVDHGVLRNVAHDRHTARQADTTSTGHALPAPNTFGPLAMNTLLTTGDGGSVDRLVAGCERGLLVTRFHYTNVVRPKETTITGMTRDGTFLVEDGKVTRAVRNLRFTQSILTALARVEAVGTETGWSEGWFGGSRCPPLRLPAFSFTGTTSFG